MKEQDYYFNGAKLTKESILKTDKYYTDLCQGCIDEVLSGEVKVNDKESYIEYNLKRKEEHLKGLRRNNLTFLQHAYYIQTGKCFALLP